MPKPLDQLSPSRIGKKSLHRQNNDLHTKKPHIHIRRPRLPVAASSSPKPKHRPPLARPRRIIEKRIEVDIYGKPVRTTASMIIHKLVASSTAYPKLFILSPNIRIEKAERAKTGKHIYEFTQLDFEARDATSKDIMTLS